MKIIHTNKELMPQPTYNPGIRHIPLVLVLLSFILSQNCKHWNFWCCPCPKSCTRNRRGFNDEPSRCCSICAFVCIKMDRKLYRNLLLINNDSTEVTNQNSRCKYALFIYWYDIFLRTSLFGIYNFLVDQDSLNLL